MKYNYYTKAHLTLLRYAVLGLIIFGVIFLTFSQGKADSSFIDNRLEWVSDKEVDALIKTFPITDPFHIITLFDLDEGLTLRTATNDASNDFFKKATEYLQTTKGLQAEQARSIVFPLYKEFLAESEKKFVKKTWNSLYGKLEGYGIHTLVITSLPADQADSTSEWLSNFDIPLSHTYFGEARTIDLPNGSVSHHKGILLCGPNPKEDTLSFFLMERHRHAPFSNVLVILYIDYGNRAIENMASSLKNFAAQKKIKTIFYGVHIKRVIPKPLVFNLTEEYKKELDTAFNDFLHSEENAVETP